MKHIIVGIVIALLYSLYRLLSSRFKKKPEDPNPYEKYIVWDKYMERLQVRVLDIESYRKELMESSIDPITVDSNAYAVMANTIKNSLAFAYDDDEERAIQEMTSGWWEGFTRAIKHRSKRK